MSGCYNRPVRAIHLNPALTYFCFTQEDFPGKFLPQIFQNPAISLQDFNYLVEYCYSRGGYYE